MRALIKLVESALSETSWDDDEEEFEDDEDTWMDDDKDDGPEVETTGYKFGKMREFYQKVKQIADLHMDSGDEIDFDEVAEWVETHRKLFQPGKITVYRTMRLTPEFVDALQPGAELGQHWTYEFDEGVLDGLDINGQPGNLYVFEAEIETADVAFPLTVAYNCLFPHEMEIFLSGHATPKLISLTEYDFNSGKSDDHARPDLVGEVFRA